MSVGLPLYYTVKEAHPVSSVAYTEAVHRVFASVRDFDSANAIFEVLSCKDDAIAIVSILYHLPQWTEHGNLVTMLERVVYEMDQLPLPAFYSFASVCKEYAQWCKRHQKIYRGFVCMEQAFEKTRNTCGNVNMALLLLLDLANEGQLLPLAYQTLKHVEIVNKKFSNDSMRSIDVYEMLLLGGYSCLSVEDYPNAFSYFLSAFHVELTFGADMLAPVLARLYLLANLVTGVEVPSLSRHGSIVISKVNDSCEIYRQFHKVFAEKGVPELYAQVVAHRSVFMTEKTMTLVNACVVRKVVQCVERMSKTHVTVPLEKLPIEDLEKIQEEGEETIGLLERLILSGELRATLDREKGTLTFCEESAIVNPAKEISHLLGRIKAGHAALHSAEEAHQHSVESGFLRRGAADVGNAHLF